MELKGRDLISCQEWTRDEIDFTLDLSQEMKRRFKIQKPLAPLTNKTLFMLFYATSTRTRNSFEASMTQLGGHAHFLEPRMLRMGDKGAPEAIKDTIKVLERYGDALGIRIYSKKYGEGELIIREYSKWGQIPVISMESDVHHPCQALADILTIKEKMGNCDNAKYVQAWGYSPNALRVPAVPQSNIMMMTRYGMDVVYAHPKEFTLDPEIVATAKKNAEESGGSYTETDDLRQAFDGAGVIYMRNHCTLDRAERGDEAEKELMEKYRNWTCTQELMDLTHKKSIFMHCLPADRGMEVTDEVIDGSHSVVFDEAENRLHVQKAVLSLVIM